jgi:hypothetical protein
MSESHTVSAREIRNRRLAARHKGSNSNIRASSTGRSHTGGSVVSASASSPVPSRAETALDLTSSPPRSPRSRPHSGIFAKPSPTNRRPPIVSPQLSPSKSWDDDRTSSRLAPRSRRFVGAVPSSDRSVSSEMAGGPSSLQYQAYSNNSTPLFSDQSFLSDSHLLSEVPMDEIAADQSIGSRNDVESKHEAQRLSITSSGNWNQQSVNRPPVMRIGGMDSAPGSGGGRRSAHLLASASVDDDVSSLGGVEDQNSSLQRITAAIKSHSSRPSGLSIEEKTLWDSMQVAIKQARVESSLVTAPSSNGNDDPNGNQTEVGSSLRYDAAWESTCHELQEQAKIQQKDHERAMRAIQRVLADVTAQRDDAQEKQKLAENAAQSIEIEAVPIPEERSKVLELENELLKNELENKASRVVILERELKVSKSKFRIPPGAKEQQVELENAEKQVVALETENVALNTDVEAKNKQISKLKRHVNGQSPSDVVTSGQVSLQEWTFLQEELGEKKTALENAKMIITSLENASGILALDMRTKLKAKEDELAVLKSGMVDRKRTMDTLATELRDLQRHQGNWEQRGGEEGARRRALVLELENNMDEMRSASVIIEATHDEGAIETVSEVLSKTITALKASIDAMEDTSADDHIANDNRDAAASELRRELKEKKTSMKRLEDNFRRLKDEAVRFQVDNERLQTQRDADVELLNVEIDKLRKQCYTNMEVLTRKERELEVLRDSLEVEDDVGYISDDDDMSDGYDDAEPDQVSSLGQYNSSQVEALATLMAQSESNSFDLGNAQVSNELEAMKEKLAEARTDHERNLKELKSEKESLANAKMIISALEMSNKSMMEDLRMRLQDSNSAITSLLAKSMESEKSAAMLRTQLEIIRKGGAEEKEKLRLEIETLQAAVAAAKGDGIISVEEKKDDAAC